MRYIILAAALAFCIAAGGCARSSRSPAPAQTGDPTTEAKARVGLADCMFARAAALDDNISDASTIGKSVSQACAADGERLFSAISIGATERQRHHLRNAWPQHVADLATQVVLRRRAAPAR